MYLKYILLLCLVDSTYPAGITDDLVGETRPTCQRLMASLEVCQSDVSDRQDMWLWAAEGKRLGSRGPWARNKHWVRLNLSWLGVGAGEHLPIGGCVLKVALSPLALNLTPIFPALATCYTSFCLLSLVLERPKCSSFTWVLRTHTWWRGELRKTRPSVT